VFNLPKNTLLGKLRLESTFQFFDVPRLFTCLNQSGCRYLVLSTSDDYESFHWLYVPISSDRLSSLISQAITLKSAFTYPEDGYLFSVVSSFSGEAKIDYILPEQVEIEDLPEDGLFLDCSERPPLGLGAVDVNVAANSSRRETCNFHFYPWDTKLPEMDVKDLGGILTSFQELSNALGQYCQGEVTLKGAIPADILEASRFRFTQVFEGSFGIQLRSKAHGDLFHNSLASDVLLELTNLLESRDDEDNISNKLRGLKGRVASKYKSFLKEIKKLDSPMKLDWGSVCESRSRSINLTKHEIRTAFELVSKIDVDMSESVSFRAELLGLDVATHRFRVKHLKDSEVYTGKIANDTLETVSHSEINGVYHITLKKIIETNSTSGLEYTKWLLIVLEAI
jgi:hypothetical protein